MEQRNGHALKLVDSVAPAEIASMLVAAQERARDQRVAVESLLAEAKLLEERLELEALQARAAAQRAVAQEHAAATIKAAQLERETIAQVDSCEGRLAELMRQRTALELTADAARSEHEAAEKVVAECELRLAQARAVITRSSEVLTDSDLRRAQLDITEASVEAEAAAAAERLTQHRAARQRAEHASIGHRALALRTPDDGDYMPSLEHVEELRRLEASIGLRAEAATRAAERRASDAARNHGSD